MITSNTISSAWSSSTVKSGDSRSGAGGSKQAARPQSSCGLPGSIVGDESHQTMDTNRSVDPHIRNALDDVGSSGLIKYYAFKTTNNDSRMPTFDRHDDVAAERFECELVVNDDSSKRPNMATLFFKDLKSSLSLVLLRFVLRVLACVMYVLRVLLDRDPSGECMQSPDGRCISHEVIPTPDKKPINWEAIIRINHPFPIWISQIALSSVTILLTMTVVCLQCKGNLLKIFSLDFLLEIAISVPTLLTLLPEQRHLFVPIFLNCWLARSALRDLFRHRSLGIYSNFNLQLVDVLATLFCLVFMGVCSFEHLQRGSSDLHYDLFQAFYFIIVTLTTVGYGDFYPDIWPTQLCMIAVMGVAFLVLPKQFESLASTWMEMQRLGGSYNKKGALQSDKHVVVCSTELTDDLVIDFLGEFFSHKHLQNFHVVFLASSDLNPDVRRILQMPLWSHRNTFIKGSCLKDEDLQRANVNEAEACFFLGADNSVDKTAADQHTILRSWAIKDFAPTVPQYVQIFRPQSIVHINFAEHVVCEDEFKYAMLAYNCMIPGTSTLITLLLHTSRGREGEDASEPWLQLYGKCSGNEVYHIVVGQSKLFGRFVGRSFSYAAVRAHRMFGVALIGLQRHQPSMDGGVHVMLNPGSGYFMQKTDVCFYLSVTREEDLTFSTRRNDDLYEKQLSNKMTMVRGVNEEHTENLRNLTAVAFGKKANDHKVEQSAKKAAHKDRMTIGHPPVTPYVGTSPNVCYLMKEKRPICCLQLNEDCKHCHHRNAKDYEWSNRVIILAADHASLGIYNFIVPLRAYFHQAGSLNPIVLLLEKRPDLSFLDSVSWFPDVYWMLGSIDNLDDLLRAGINVADNVVVVNKETSNAAAEEEDLSDCNTIVGVQSVFKYFPNVKITTELAQSSNMRFMHFQANNAYALHLSEVEKHEKKKGSIISFMFRLQFASGIVFSAGMVDTLLYQAFVKDYLIPIVRLILGIDQAPGSAFLTSIEVDIAEPWMETYGSVFSQLCELNGDVPIAVFRTQYEVGIGSTSNTRPSTMPGVYRRYSEQEQIANLIKSRMSNLNMQPQSYDGVPPTASSNKVSYVIINPNFDLPLQERDIIFLLRPPPG